MSYWDDRAAETAEALARAWDDLDAMRSAYERAADSIEAELARLEAKYSTGKLTRSEVHRYNQMNRLRKEVHEACHTAGKATEETGLDVIAETIDEGYGAAADDIAAALGGTSAGVHAGFDGVSEDLFNQLCNAKWRGSNFSDRVWENTGDLEKVLNKVLADGLTRGDGAVRMAEAIEAKMHAGYKNAIRLARTESAYAYNSARMAGYRENGIGKVQVVASPDERRCPACGALHEKVFDIGNAPILPLHPNCRCSVVPYVNPDEGFEDILDMSDEELTREDGIDNSGRRGIMNAEVNSSKAVANPLDLKRLGTTEQSTNAASNGSNRLNIGLQFFAQSYSSRNNAQIRKSIRSNERNLQTHFDKMQNPAKYVAGWDDMTSEKQDGLLRHWQHEIKTFEDEIARAKEELQKRGEI